MEHGCHANDGGGTANLITHSILRFIYIAENRRQGTVIPDGACKDIRHMVFFAVVNDAVVDVLFFQKSGDASVEAYPIDGIQMVVMSVWLIFLSIDAVSYTHLDVYKRQILNYCEIPSAVLWNRKCKI